MSEKSEMKKKIAVITGGSVEDTFASGFLSEWKPDGIIAADKGLEYCLRAGIRPDYIVGDFDSADPSARSHFTGIPTDVYKPEKDAGDTEIALYKAVELGADEVAFLGATGTRLDHTLVNILNLARLHEKGITGWIVDPHNRIHIAPEKHFTMRRDEQFGKYVSFLPYGGPVEGLTLKGFKYPLENFRMTAGNEGLFVSNELSEDVAEVSCTSGTLIVLESRD